MTRIAVASRSFSRHPVLRQELLRRYPDVTFNDAGLSLSGAALCAFLRGHQKAITALERLEEGIFTAVPELQVVSKFGVGLDMIDLPAMARHGVKLGWRSGVNRRSVAELTLAFALSLLRHVPQASATVRRGEWRYDIGQQLTGRTVGIIGCGNVGKEVVRLLAPFECRILVHDIRPDREFLEAHRIESVTLERVLAEAQIVTVHVPLTSGTRNLLDGKRLSLMTSSAVLINTARGGVVDEAALKAMLKNRKIAAAAFDVFAREPSDDAELLSLPNFLGTPHIGGATEEAVLAMGRAAIEGLDDFGDALEIAGEHA